MGSRKGALLTVPQARSLLAAALEALEARKQEINDLNVYPVPDGDTGTNLALTVRSIVAAVAKLPDDLPANELCATVSQAALMGARGNSGVILSQIVRGAMEVLEDGEAITVTTLAAAFRNATETAYRAVRRPVEGTMLTVLREMAEAAEAVPDDSRSKAFMDTVLAAGWKSVERTPSLLRVLADAGVVDAGGFGLVVLLEGTGNGRGVAETPIAAGLESTAPSAGAPVTAAPGAGGAGVDDDAYTYCVSFLVTGKGLDQASLEEEAGRFGGSLLVVGDSERLKVHVHTNDPGMMITLGSSRGVLSEIEIDNMEEQTAERTERLAQGVETQGKQAGDTGFVQDVWAGNVPVPEADTFEPFPGFGVTTPVETVTQVVAVVAGEGNKGLFRSLGVDLIVDGGQSMNPSAEDLLRAVEKAVAPSVVILPNNGNVIMTAEQTLALTVRDVHVVPSDSIPAGLCAAVAYDPRASGEANAKEMGATLEHVVTAEITQAVRESQVDGVKIAAADFIALVDGRVLMASPQIEEVIESVMATLLTDDRIMLTVLLGEGEAAKRAGEAIEQARQRYPGVEIDVHEGGQPYYPVLFAVE